MMKSSLLRLLTTAVSAIALTAAVSFANEPEKKDTEKKCPGCPDSPTQVCAIECNKHCGKCDSKCDQKGYSDCSRCPSECSK